jgi:hypothetical protein
MDVLPAEKARELQQVQITLDYDQHGETCKIAVEK